MYGMYVWYVRSVAGILARDVLNVPRDFRFGISVDEASDGSRRSQWHDKVLLRRVDHRRRNPVNEFSLEIAFEGWVGIQCDKI